MEPPRYFNEIREKAAARWKQLEADPELAGPWHQLFQQVQSPRHVLSELLQNADDAGATEAAISVKDGVFSFTHNGGDFTREHFGSLCGFGYSNKRALHTIGFRGVGFKSIFSLGNRVELYSPTLAVAFERKRFTLPTWISGVSRSVTTEVRVKISDARRKEEVERNLKDWTESPLSLLFFTNIRQLKIGSHILKWVVAESGPVDNSDWMILQGVSKEKVLVARSKPEPFPEDALEEIREERLLAAGQEAVLPPCRVELVLGVEGRLYVVLPTGVKTELPFACNAPFMQDPARVKIKDPETSPTNRWLLERAGKLAAQVMLQWISNTKSDLAERCHAYDLFTDVDRDDSSLEGVCGCVVEESIGSVLADKAFLITDQGAVEQSENVVVIPDAITDAWPSDQATTLFDEQSRSPLSRHIKLANREKLVNWGMVAEIERADVLSVLCEKHLPKPKTWRQLMGLWAYLAPDLVSWSGQSRLPKVRIVPVVGSDVLHSPEEVVRLGDKRLLQSDDDWQFLSDYLKVLNPNWPRYIAEQRRSDGESQQDYAKAAYSVLSECGLTEAGNVDEVIENVARGFFEQDSLSIRDCVRLAQIAAALGGKAGESFYFVARNSEVRNVADGLLYDGNGTLEAFLPAEWAEAWLLHPDYLKRFKCCSKEDWNKWTTSGQSGLLPFPLPDKKKNYVSGKKSLKGILLDRGITSELHFPYVTHDFRIEDWDFDESLWEYWSASAGEDSMFWGKLSERILMQSGDLLEARSDAVAYQIATTGRTRKVTWDSLPALWILKLRNLPCLPDTRGFLHKPGDLLRRTPETEPLLDVEPFVNARLDNEATRPLLEMLGVRDQPTGPDRILDCLRALARAKQPPAHEVEKWYRRLDQLLDACTTEDRQKIIGAFRDEKLIYSAGNVWVHSTEVFRTADESDAPHAEFVRDSVRDLSLWAKTGVEERPSVELAIEWLKQLPTAQQLLPEQLRRVRALLPRYPHRIWNDAGRWLNLAGEMVDQNGIQYSVAMQSLVSWRHLHDPIKQKTADFQALSIEITASSPFSEVEPLGAHIEDRLQNTLALKAGPERKDWLNHFGAELRRIDLPVEAEAGRIRSLATRLNRTGCNTLPVLEIVPYIDGIPVGTSRRADAVWQGDVLYLADRPPAKLALAIAQELGKEFNRSDIADAIKFCFERSPAFISEYLEEHFSLLPPDKVPVQPIEELPPLMSEQSTVADQIGIVVTEDEEEISTSMQENFDTDEIGVEQFANLPDPASDKASNVARVVLQPQAPRKQPLMARFVKSLGYVKDGEDRYYNSDGGWFQKTHGERSLWERWRASGELIGYYWPKDHCLESQPLEIEADIWTLIEQHPDSYSFVLENQQGKPVQVDGRRLKRMREEGKLNIYPATYRLVMVNDND